MRHTLHLYIKSIRHPFLHQNDVCYKYLTKHQASRYYNLFGKKIDMNIYACLDMTV